MVTARKIIKVLARKNNHFSRSRKEKVKGMMSSLNALNISMCYQRRSGNHWFPEWFTAIDKVDLILKSALANR